MRVAIRFAAGSDVGLVRKNNEDSAYAGPWLVAVADGLGGHVAGEVASAAVIESLRPIDREVPEAELLDTLGTAVGQANERLARMGEEDAALNGMGTTLTAMLWSGTHVALAHVGDTRGYLLRAGELEQITEDHSLGQLLAEEGAPPGHSNVLLRVLDGRPDRSPDLTLRAAQVYDRYLLCSDGLSGVVSVEALAEVLSTVTDLEQTVGQLIELAKQGGAPDNVTAVVVDVVEVDDQPELVPVLVGAARPD